MSDKLKIARENYEVALNHFNWVDHEHIDSAIEELNTALGNLNSVCKELKMPTVEI